MGKKYLVVIPERLRKTCDLMAQMNHAVRPHAGDNGAGFCPRTGETILPPFLFNPDVETGDARPGS